MKKKKQKEFRSKSLITTSLYLFMGLTIGISLLALLGFEAQKTSIVNGGLETSLTTLNNVLSMDGLKSFLGDIVSNFQNFEPFALIIISLIGIGIADSSGLIKAIFSRFQKTRASIVIFITFLFAVLFGFFGEYALVFVIPFTGVVYKALGKNPILGIITAFFGLTIGYGTNVMVSYDDYLLGQLTQSAARVEVDQTYTFSLLSNIFIMIGSTLIISLGAVGIINKLIVPKVGKFYKEEAVEEIVEAVPNKLPFLHANISMLLIVLFLIYQIIPGLPFSGFFLDSSESKYIAQLFGYDSPFRKAFIVILSIVLMVGGYVYSKGIERNKKIEHTDKLPMIFNDLGILFVLCFFFSQIIGIVKWSNIGEVVSAKLVDIMSVFPISGIPLIMIVFVAIILMNFFLPALLDKWILTAPIIVPLFMRSNITPEFTQFIFKVADGIGKSMTPLFPYFIIFVAFVKKYETKQHYSMLGILKIMMPAIFLFITLWILILIGWYIVGLPIGVGVYPTL